MSRSCPLLVALAGKRVVQSRMKYFHLLSLFNPDLLFSIVLQSLWAAGEMQVTPSSLITNNTGGHWTHHFVFLSPFSPACK